MMDKHDPYPFGPSTLLDAYESALRATMQPNFWPSMGGGGLEQVGATQAVNELLLQSYQGFLLLFPGWPIGESASFTTLRAVGAFLVSASVDATGTVSGVTVVSEAGQPCVILSPWGGAVLVVDSAGAQVETASAGEDKWSFQTVAQGRYAVSPQSSF